ncbi:MAG: leucyl/phenylalanyl-tRNA--protein transferase [Lachnospiraceae bacterium]|nr:leucyl/phenylalanyl-tRNA--protein transferase [Lachnospiraceae bacterium]
MAVFQLEEDKIYFPKPELADDDGLLAVGGDLSVDRLLLAYSNGIFPWYNADQPIMWWCPHERFIIKPSEIHVSHSLRKYIRKHKVDIMYDRDFADTMHRCRMKREFKEGTWIHDDMENAYYALHDKGYAMSVEAFVDNELAGGLYGVVIGRCFFGESMFSDKENGSKLALVGLANLLDDNNFMFIDCQFHTDHLESMGGVRISYEEFMNMVEEGFQIND